MAKKASKAAEPEPLKLFYIFYNQERWDNWQNTLRDASFEMDPKSDEMPEGFRLLDGFSVDITLSVLKIVKLFQNKRFTKEEALTKVAEVEAIVMASATDPALTEIIEAVQLPKLALFAACRKYLEGGFDKDIKVLIKKGKAVIDKDMEQALGIVSDIGASVIDGAACCGKYVKDDIEEPTLFDEWLVECERMHDGMVSLKNFDESTGDED
ncbi:MAG: DUF2150 family protein [Methanoregula sp.]|jgi:hypothetical protein